MTLTVYFSMKIEPQAVKRYGLKPVPKQKLKVNPQMIPHLRKRWNRKCC